MDDQRKYMRASSEARVEMSHPSFGIIELKARDLSEGGVFVFLGNHIAPPIGTVVKARIRRHTGLINQQPVDMQVVHHDGVGVGLMFV
jgi:PilZ domain